MPLDNLGFETEDPTALGAADSWARVYFDTGVSAATFDLGTVANTPEPPFESFRAGWSTNEDAITAFVGVGTDLSAPVFDNTIGPEGLEDFEEGWGNTSFAYLFAAAETGEFDGLPFVVAQTPEPLALTDGDTLELTASGGGPATSDPFSGTAAEEVGALTLPLSYSGASRFRLTIDDGLPTAIDLDGAVTAGDAVGIINAAMGATVASTDGSDIFITSPTAGSVSRIEIESIQPAVNIATNPAPYALTDGDTLEVRVDFGSFQTITFLAADFPDIANATAFEVAQVINEQLVGGYADAYFGLVRIFSDTIGEATSEVGINASPAATVLGMSGSARDPLSDLGLSEGVTTGSGNVRDLAAVTYAEIASVVNGSSAIEAIGAELRDVTGELRAYDTVAVGGSIDTTSTDPVNVALDFDPLSAAAPGVTSELFEDLEEGWSGDASPYATNHLDISTTTQTSALFDTANDAFEDFEEEWGNSAILDEWADVTASTAVFDSDTGSGGANEAFEDFEETAFDLVFTVDTSTDRLTTASVHGLSNDYEVEVYSNDQLPSPLSPDRTYFAEVVSTTELLLRNVAGGSSIDITTTGNGTHYLKRSPRANWTTEL